MSHSRCQRKVDGTVLGVILFRLPENSILMDEISEKIFNEELNKLFLVAKGMGSPRHAKNRRRRARQRPEPACVQTPLIAGWHTQGEKGELTSCRGTVQSAWQRPPVSRTRGKARLPARVSGDHVVRGRRSSPIPAQASRVSVAVRGAPR